MSIVRDARREGNPPCWSESGLRRAPRLERFDFARNPDNISEEKERGRPLTFDDLEMVRYSVHFDAMRIAADPLNCGQHIQNMMEARKVLAVAHELERIIPMVYDTVLFCDRVCQVMREMIYNHEHGETQTVRMK